MQIGTKMNSTTLCGMERTNEMNETIERKIAVIESCWHWSNLQRNKPLSHTLLYAPYTNTYTQCNCAMLLFHSFLLLLRTLYVDKAARTDKTTHTHILCEKRLVFRCFYSVGIDDDVICIEMAVFWAGFYDRYEVF